MLNKCYLYVYELRVIEDGIILFLLFKDFFMEFICMSCFILRYIYNFCNDVLRIFWEVYF